MKAKQKQQPNDKATACWNSIGYFFELYNQEDAKEDLWAMLKLALTGDDEETTARERRNMICLYEQTSRLFENIHTLLQEHKQANSKPNN